MYREVHMAEVKEVVLLWLAGTGKKRIGVQLGLEVKTVRRYVRAAYKVGLRVGEHTALLSEEVVGAILKEIRPAAARERGEARAKCERHRAELQSLSWFMIQDLSPAVLRHGRARASDRGVLRADRTAAGKGQRLGGEALQAGGLKAAVPAQFRCWPSP